MAKAKTYEEVIAKRKKIAKRDRRARRIQVVILSILLVFIALSTAGFAYAIYAKFTTIEEFILLYQNVPLLIITAACIVLLFLFCLIFLIYKAIKRRRKDIQVVVSQNMMQRLAFMGGNGAAQKGGQTSNAPKEEGAPEGAPLHRFKALSGFDEIHPKFEKIGMDHLKNLKNLADSFRAYAAGTLNLYYTEKDIRCFLASLACSHVVLLQGMSGTGKTSLPVAFGKWIANMTDVVPVQPTWKERSDMLGYYNEFTGTFSETPLLRALYEAGGNDQVQLIVLDEANIARIEYYFAEFLSLLELPDTKARVLQVAPSELPGDPIRLPQGSLTLPSNVWFILTANNDDSTFAISDKVYDRAMVLDLDKRAEAFQSPETDQVRLSEKGFNTLCKRAMRRYALTRRDQRRIAQLDEFLRTEMHIGFGNRITRQIKQFVPCYIAAGGDELEGLDVVLARKVMRKLGSASPVYLRAKEGALLQLMASLWGEGTMKECEEAIRRLAESK